MFKCAFCGKMYKTPAERCACEASCQGIKFKTDTDPNQMTLDELENLSDVSKATAPKSKATAPKSKAKAKTEPRQANTDKKPGNLPKEIEALLDAALDAAIEAAKEADETRLEAALKAAKAIDKDPDEADEEVDDESDDTEDAEEALEQEKEDTKKGIAQLLYEASRQIADYEARYDEQVIPLTGAVDDYSFCVFRGDEDTEVWHTSLADDTTGIDVFSSRLCCGDCSECETEACLSCFYNIPLKAQRIADENKCSHDCNNCASCKGKRVPNEKSPTQGTTDRPQADFILSLLRLWSLLD